MKNEEQQEEKLEENQEQEEQEESIDDVEKIKKENETLKAQKSHWKKKYDEASAKPKEAKEEPKSKEEKSDEPDYYKDLTLRTFMKGEGVDSKDDQDWLLKESKELKKPIEDLLSKPYYKAELKNRKDQREAEAGMPDSSGQGTKGTKNSVDYWVDKKNPKNPEEYMNPADPKLAAEVINARIAKEKSRNMFADDMY